MEKTAWKGTFAEAEETDNLFWASQSSEERLKALVDIRATVFRNCGGKIEKVVTVRELHSDRIIKVLS